MNASAKFGLLFVGGILVIGVAGKHLASGGEHSAYIQALNERPYTDRDLAKEYGLDPNWKPKTTGAWAAASNGSYVLKRNNALEAEASRIQLEFEDKLGTAGALLSMATPGASIDALCIARQRFEDQGLIEPNAK